MANRTLRLRSRGETKRQPSGLGVSARLPDHDLQAAKGEEKPGLLVASEWRFAGKAIERWRGEQEQSVCSSRDRRGVVIVEPGTRSRHHHRLIGASLARAFRHYEVGASAKSPRGESTAGRYRSPTARTHRHERPLRTLSDFLYTGDINLISGDAGGFSRSRVLLRRAAPVN